MTPLLFPFLTAILGGLIGGGVTHYFAARRDLAIKRREIILSNLMAALEDLDQSNTLRHDAELKRMEKVVYRIQIVGDPDMVSMANDIADTFVLKGEVDSTNLLVALRTKIRQELKLPPLPSGFHYLTIDTDPKSDGENDD